MRVRFVLFLLMTLLTTARGLSAQDASPILGSAEQRALILKIAGYLREECTCFRRSVPPPQTSSPAAQPRPLMTNR